MLRTYPHPQRPEVSKPPAPNPVPLTEWEITGGWECPTTGYGGVLWKREVKLPDGSVETDWHWGRVLPGRVLPPPRRWYEIHPVPLRGEGQPPHYHWEPPERPLPDPLSPVRRPGAGKGYKGFR